MTHERRNLTNPSDWWVAFQYQAEKEDLTLSEWMGMRCLIGLDCINESLSECRWGKLSERTPPGKPKKSVGPFTVELCGEKLGEIDSFEVLDGFPDDPKLQPLTTKKGLNE